MKVKSEPYDDRFYGDIVRVDVERIVDDLDTIKKIFSAKINFYEPVYFPQRLLSPLAVCEDVMPDNVCNYLEMPKGSRFSLGVLRLKELAQSGTDEDAAS